MTSNLRPHMYVAQLPGIPGIDGFELPYGSWHLLNEALTCFINNEHYACLVCLAASVESWLRRKLRTGAKKNFVVLIRQAKKSKIISDDEAKEFNELRKIRNMYIHFDRKKFPRVKSIRTAEIKDRVTAFSEIDELIELHGIEVSPYPTRAHKDFIPLSALTPTSYLFLNSTIRFFMRRYPRKDRWIASYYRFILLKIEGIDNKEVVIRLEPSKKTNVKLINRLLASLRKIFHV